MNGKSIGQDKPWVDPDLPYRGTGRTTRAMQAAPRGALYIWPVMGSISYAKDLARKLGLDLDIQPVNFLLGGRWHGREWPAVVVDHAAYRFFSEGHWEAFQHVCARCGRPK